MFITATKNPSAREAAAIATAADSVTRTRRQKQEHRASPHSHFSFFGACFFSLTGLGGLPALPAGDATARAGDAAAGDAAGAGVVPRLAP